LNLKSALEYAGYLLDLQGLKQVVNDDKIINVIKIGPGFAEDEIVVGLVLSACGWTYCLRGYEILSDVVVAATRLVKDAIDQWTNKSLPYHGSLKFNISEHNLMELAKQKEPAVEVASVPTLCLATTAVVGSEFTLSFIKFGIDSKVEWLVMDMPGNFSNFVEICGDAVDNGLVEKLEPWPADTCCLGDNDSAEMAYRQGTIRNWIECSEEGDLWYRYLGKSCIHPEGDRRGKSYIDSMSFAFLTNN
jgi:hypothetical protein